MGLAGVVTTTRLTESMLYGIRPTDPVTLAGGTLFLVAVGVAGSLLPAGRAAGMDPISALREE